MYAYSELESPHRVAARLFHANEWRQHSLIFLQWSGGLYPIPPLPQTGYRYVCGVKCGLKQYKALSVWMQRKLFTRYVKLINVQAGTMQRESSNRQYTKFEAQSVPVYKLRTPVTHGVVLGYVTRVVRWLLTSHAIKFIVRCTGVAKYIPGVVHIIVHSLRSNVQGIFKSTTRETVYFNSVRH